MVFLMYEIKASVLVQLKRAITFSALIQHTLRHIKEEQRQELV